MFQRFAAIALLCLIAFFLLPIDHWAAFADGLPAIPDSGLVPPPVIAPLPGVDLSAPATSLTQAIALALATVMTGVLGWIGHGIVGLLSSKASSEQAKARADTIRAKIDDVSHDLKMNELADQVAAELVGAAANMSGLKLEDLKNVKIRNPTLRLAAKLGAAQWADMWKWVDQDENGQIDWLESKLAKFLPPAEHDVAAGATTAPAAA